MQSTTKKSRFEARLSPRQRELFERAAAMQGRTLSEFVVSAAIEKAEEVIQTHEVIRLTENDYAQVVELLRDPPEPNEELKRGMQRWRELVRSDISDTKAL